LPEPGACPPRIVIAVPDAVVPFSVVNRFEAEPVLVQPAGVAPTVSPEKSSE
jgi:hypothetical protein